MRLHLRILMRLLARRPSPPAARVELVRVLGLLASYNDKGHIWMRHDTPTQTAFRAARQAELLALVATLGPLVLGDGLVTAIRSGEAMRDDSGRYAERARQRLGVP